MSEIERKPGGLERGVNRLQTGCILVLSNLFLGAFCLWGVYAAYTGWQLQSKGETTTGTVVRLAESDSAEGGCCVYSPVVEFRADGRIYSFESDHASDPPAYKAGQEVAVRYDPANPATAQIDSIIERWLFPIIIIPAMLFTALLIDFFLVRALIRGESVGDD